MGNKYETRDKLDNAGVIANPCWGKRGRIGADAMTDHQHNHQEGGLEHRAIMDKSKVKQTQEYLERNVC